MLGDGECQSSLAKHWFIWRETRGAAKREALSRYVFHDQVPAQTYGLRWSASSALYICFGRSENVRRQPT
jgi:hypothetical protein